MQSLSIEKLKTDVLVIGAGAGGMMAAISAADEGVDVTLCEKGNARRSGGITAGNDQKLYPLYDCRESYGCGYCLPIH
jgi:succinate dehydrogenase/fumarate reductase flavoprotein subunit